jgi:transcriptional regulator with XRE-family HTH domain
MSDGKLPNTVDRHVGRRLRWRRRELKLSQEKLAEMLGLTFQQVQKYERGVNRVSAGRLYEVASMLGVSVGYFFDGVEEIAAIARNSVYEGTEEAAAELLDMIDSEAVELLTAFRRIPDTKLRKSLLSTVVNTAAAFDADPVPVLPES